MVFVKRQHHLFIFLTALFASLGSCATSASGPTAYISLAASPPYATLRPCAAACLVYQGVWACGVNSGYYDLGIELACGCSPQNFCYCDSAPKAAASASSYISSCVNKGCGADFPGEVTSAIDLYNGYCSTANVAAAVQTSAPSLIASSSAKSTVAANSPNTNLDANANASSSSTSNIAVTAETSAPKTSSTATEKKGLAQSDVIALAVGLGVGLPSLLLALATFCLQRKRKERQNTVRTEIHYVK